MPNLFDVKDPRGKKVYCDADWWKKHILTSRPFMANWVQRVIDAIKKPTCITQDAGHHNRNNYYRLVVRKKGARRIRQYTKVVVEFADVDVGSLITAHPDNNITKAESILWQE